MWYILNLRSFGGSDIILFRISTNFYKASTYFISDSFYYENYYLTADYETGNFFTSKNIFSTGFWTTSIFAPPIPTIAWLRQSCKNINWGTSNLLSYRVSDESSNPIDLMNWKQGSCITIFCWIKLFFFFNVLNFI